eukprot:3833972-Amphidinium_carterae.1
MSAARFDYQLPARHAPSYPEALSVRECARAGGNEPCVMKNRINELQHNFNDGPSTSRLIIPKERRQRSM